MKFNYLKAMFAGIVMFSSVCANAGLMKYDYTGPTGTNVDTRIASTFSIDISDDYIIEDLMVQIHLTGLYPYWHEIDVWLSNGPTSVQLIKANNKGAYGLFNVNFSDHAATKLPTRKRNGTDAIGDFTPYSPLSVFSGQRISGTWTLSISDNIHPDEGLALTGFNLSATTVPEPSSLTIFGLALIGLASVRVRK